MSSRPARALEPASAADTARAPRPGPGDRLGATLVLALIAHGVLILGIGFAVDAPAPVQPTLEVILGQTRSEPAEDAQYLAALSQRGGGDEPEPERPREPQPASLPQPEPGLAPQELPAQAPPPAERPQPAVLESEADAEAAVPAETEADPDPLLPAGPDRVETELEMARLSAEIARERERLAGGPRRKFVSANTREYAWADYVRAWVERVERIGNLNYPDEARRRGLEGRLVLTVAVRRDGSLETIDLVRGSGVPVLDEAAIRSVRLAQPFPPLPATAEAVDVLHITRTWRYLPGGRLRQEP